MLRAGLLLGLFAVAGTGIVAMTETFTQEQIAANERAALQQAIAAVLPPAAYNNPILEDTLPITAPALLGTEEPLLAYRARQDGRPVAVILTAVAPEGYNGAIKLLVGIRYDGSLTGVRVVSHKETPGLGDEIEEEKSSWILGFTGLSLGAPPESKWQVKRDGGIFDQFTGATITPRTIVKTVRNTLRYFKNHRDRLFAEKEKNLNGTPPR
ncbi:electron transport complex subunit RsxG [Nitrosococcus oceani]|uniref:Ion-translocating oxidoreductase complex subunit G n=2 Tax=Nitrosococcus oceani TaxID=1229 RepID=Q3JBX2_NITOC|nr:electron transport complex subunit RsxG [Nitrosococcus oceani]KFI19962.1 electron transporter RnfG [Nitrosococcus oceani C-27]ABA57674.1 Electron transport complex, RnfABCDGE type, G subunit [Nitrosococcus oceani ATCC 19707]EDZ68426.1 electron transport complex, RnfABCDGE type, G subunit subfamily [Nitrosococcus oceani AFC27]KFI23118.1 electron transporter RnfG [Nitrosococcus oceani]GEM19322.1 electron transport complex subunit RsxG [Nitrosococcus oceani]